MSGPLIRVGDGSSPGPQPGAAADVPVEPDGQGPLRSLAPFSLRALRISDEGWGANWSLQPAPMRRAWMDAQPYTYQCPPLAIANQWGWQILCPADVLVSWDGSPDPPGVRVKVEAPYAASIKSQFGQGIVTFGPPWLFRTSPGWDLHVQGPSNHWKANCAALEGIVESWWLPYTFTLNWKLVTPGVVGFARGEPLAQLVPVPHATFEGSAAIEAPLSSDPEAEAALNRWQSERQRRASEKVTTHHFYRKAEGVPDHLVRVPVPPVARTGAGI